MVHSRGVSSASATAVEPSIAPSDDTGASQADALVAGLSRASIMLTFFSAAGILLLVLLRRFKAKQLRPADLAAAAAVTTHTIPVPQEA
jgi:hypothetical protein